jgi:hypothetical protein
LMAAACGGGGYDSGSYGGGSSISGTATKGPLSGATVTAYAIVGGQRGPQIGSATTDSNGNYNITLSSYTGAVMLLVNGGSYTDEATGDPVMMAPDFMTAVIPSMLYGTTVSGIQITPITSMAQTRAQQITGGMTDANINTANTALCNYFSISDILRVRPMNPRVPGSKAGASQDARNYGIALAAMSQYAFSLNLASGAALVTAMMDDASDGVMDGKRGTVSILMRPMMGSMIPMASAAGTTGLATAMTSFITNTSANGSGVNAQDVAVLRQKLMISDGTLCATC